MKKVPSGRYVEMCGCFLTFHKLSDLWNGCIRLEINESQSNSQLQMNACADVDINGRLRCESVRRLR